MYAADSLDCNTAKCQNPTEIVNLSSYQKVGFLSISEESSIGAVIRSVSRKNLEALKISLLPYEKQQVIGDLWFDGIELKKLKMRLAELENTEHNNRLKRYIKTFGGR